MRKIIWPDLFVDIHDAKNTKYNSLKNKMVKCNPLAFYSEGREWGVGSVVVEFGVLGAPRFSVQRSQNTCFKGFWDL